VCEREGGAFVCVRERGAFVFERERGAFVCVRESISLAHTFLGRGPSTPLPLPNVLSLFIHCVRSRCVEPHMFILQNVFINEF